MRRQAMAAAFGGITVGVVVGGILIGAWLTSGGHRASTGTPVPTVKPVSTQTVPTGKHKVVLAPAFRRFVNHVCSSFQLGRPGFLVSHLMYFNYDNRVYYSPFNLALGTWAVPSQLTPWTQDGNVHCVRVSQSAAGHAVLVTKGWPLDGGWGIIDMDVPTASRGWRLNDFTFGPRAQVLGAFFANEHRSIAYRSRV